MAARPSARILILLGLLLVALFFDAPSAAQFHQGLPDHSVIRRLPPVEPDWHVELASHPRKLSEPLLELQHVEDPLRKVGDPRPGLFQKLNITGTWLAGESVADFGWTELEFDATFGFPFLTSDEPLIVRPGFDSHFLEGPVAADMPARLYDAYVEFRTFRKLGDRWFADLAMTPGWHSDFDSGSRTALRVTAHGFAAFQWSETTTLVAGVIYLDRDDVDFLPAAGIVWKPSDGLSFELTAPRPRIAWRVFGSDLREDWLYVVGEFGGGTYAIRRGSGVEDVVTYRDWRVMLGWETKKLHGVSSRLEVGHVFSRELEYASATPNFTPGDTVLVRLGVKY